MKTKHLSHVLANLRQVREDPRMEPVHWQKLRKAEREFEVLGRSGRMDKRKVFRAAKLVTDVLVESLELVPEEENSDDPEPARPVASSKQRVQAQET